MSFVLDLVRIHLFITFPEFIDWRLLSVKLDVIVTI
jgi:hypothetical protein